jgi:hypothetical protein
LSWLFNLSANICAIFIGFMWVNFEERPSSWIQGAKLVKKNHKYVLRNCDIRVCWILDMVVRECKVWKIAMRNPFLRKEPFGVLDEEWKFMTQKWVKRRWLLRSYLKKSK